MSRFLIRADASNQIGSGHVMRMIALGQRLLSKGQDVHFATVPHNRAILNRLRRENFFLHEMEDNQSPEADCRSLIETAGALSPRYIILDGYHFASAYQERLKAAGFRLLYVDDLGGRKIHADIVLNQNISADSFDYDQSGAATYYLGPEYALLRNEFIESAKSSRRSFPSFAKNILVTLGGGDPDNLTLEILKKMRPAAALRIKAVLGGLNPHKTSISDYVRSAKLDVEILEDVGETMPELIKWADMGICATGSTILEMSLLGLPCMAVCLAENQAAIWRQLMGRNAIFGFQRGDLESHSFSEWFSTFAGDARDRQERSERLASLNPGRLIFQLESHLIHGVKQAKLTRRVAEERAADLLGLINKSRYVHWGQDNLLLDLQDKWELSRVLLKDDEVASVCITSLKQDAAYVHFLAVDERLQGKGFGHALLETLQMEAAKRGVKKISLRCATENARALRFYEEEGFTVSELVEDETSRPYIDKIMVKSV